MVEIRCCQLEEVPQLIKLLKQADLYYEGCDSEVSLENKIWSEFDSILVAVDGDRIVGMVITICDPWISFIYHGCVDPEYQRQGIATQLREEAERRLKENGAKVIVGYVYPKNKRSRTLLKKAGYQEDKPALPVYKVL